MKKLFDPDKNEMGNIKTNTTRVIINKVEMKLKFLQSGNSNVFE